MNKVKLWFWRALDSAAHALYRNRPAPPSNWLCRHRGEAMDAITRETWAHR